MFGIEELEIVYVFYSCYRGRMYEKYENLTKVNVTLYFILFAGRLKNCINTNLSIIMSSKNTL